MLPSVVLLAAVLPLALSVPSPRRGGGGGGGGLALAVAAGVIAADSQNGYSTDRSNPPDSGYDASTTCTYTGGTTTTIAAAAGAAWMGSMNGCLSALAANNWSGNECAPPTGGQFGFYKGENDYPDAVDCFSRCQGCLGSAINATQAVTTKCQYEYKTPELLGSYKTHTCTMGYDAQ